MSKNIYTRFLQQKEGAKKNFAVLIDPDKENTGQLENTIGQANAAGVDYFFLGGSLVMKNCLEECLNIIKANSDIPVILFPGSTLQISNKADAIFFLSLISGRNPELLIGNHVIAAPYLKQSKIEIIPTGYILIDGGAPTTVSYISNTQPIPADKKEVAACTALAGEMLGLKLIYMDAGSGAKKPISENMIAEVRKNVQVPIITGGGIRTPEKAAANCTAGADIIVVGNAVEEKSALIAEIADAVHSAETIL